MIDGGYGPAENDRAFPVARSLRHQNGVRRVSITIRNRPVTSFLLITFGVSYALGVPFNIAASSLFDSSSLVGLYLPRVVTVIGPAVAAVVVALAGGGVIPVSRLFHSLRLRVDDVPWIASAAVVGLVSAGAAFVLAGLPAETLVNVLMTRAPLLFGHVLIQVALIGIGEELGWRGWLLPTLSGNRSFLAATALTGLAWAFWHLPLFFSGLSIALSFTVLVASLSIAFSWLWYRTAGRVGVMALAPWPCQRALLLRRAASTADAGRCHVDRPGVRVLRRVLQCYRSCTGRQWSPYLAGSRRCIATPQLRLL